MEKRPDVKAVTACGDTLLHLAARKWDGGDMVAVAMVQTLVKAGADVKAVNKDGKCPLDEARYASVHLLIKELMRTQG